ncbi:hypothetical protein GCM10022267_51560 [Lentzea roselyniae]|uniref:Bacterial transcriptional activator domain-containing protein n=1 Tax=Lentzea roselyniae TaxID=531940 RepID=A0ABP7BH41_9PSEU
MHWAHRVRHRFPDGDLYLDLQGYDLGQPVSAEDALASLLRTVVEGDEPLPPSLSERAARFRTALANRRMLISRNNLASAYESAGDLGRAIPLYEATLTDCERVL